MGRPLPRFDDTALEERARLLWEEDDTPTLTHRSAVRLRRRPRPRSTWRRRTTDPRPGWLWRDPRSWTCVVLGAALGVVSGVLVHVEASERDGEAACGERVEAARVEPRPRAYPAAPLVAQPPATAGPSSTGLPLVRVNDLPRAR